jgi:hypothetical protein
MAVRHKPQMGMGRGEIYDGPVLTFGLLFGLLALLTAGLLNYLYRRPFPSTLTACLAVMLTVAVGICSMPGPRLVAAEPADRFQSAAHVRDWDWCFWRFIVLSAAGHCGLDAGQPGDHAPDLLRRVPASDW